MKENLIGFILFAALLSLAVLPNRGVGAYSDEKEGNGERAAVLDSEPESESRLFYPLPYPGILPNNPLYPLKALRDRVLEFLIRDPLKKADFYLLMSDKRLNMGIFLTDRKQPSLAESTVSKGEKYFFKGVELVENIESQEEKQQLANKYKKALLKHEEVVNNLKNNSPEKLKPGYTSSLKLIKKMQEKLDNLEV